MFVLYDIREWFRAWMVLQYFTYLKLFAVFVSCILLFVKELVHTDTPRNFQNSFTLQLATTAPETRSINKETENFVVSEKILRQLNVTRAPYGRLARYADLWSTPKRCFKEMATLRIPELLQALLRQCVREYLIELYRRWYDTANY